MFSRGQGRSEFIPGCHTRDERSSLPQQNQMQDAMTIWDSICHSQWFKQTSIVGRIAWFYRIRRSDAVYVKILFLNKNDLFERKIPTSDIKNFFPVSTTISYSRTSIPRLIVFYRISKESLGIFAPVAITSSDGSQNWLKKLVVRKSARYIYSELLCFSSSPNNLTCYEVSPPLLTLPCCGL